MYEHRYASSQTHRRATPVHRLDFVHHTLASVQGRRRQLHSARRQTTFHSARGQPLDAVSVQGILSRTGPFIIPGLNDTSSSETVLQGPSCVSATHSHTRTWPQWVYASKLVCDALAVAGVNRRPFGLLPALLQEACMCERHKRHACVQDTFLYIPILCVYGLRAEARALSPLFSMVINTKAQQAQYATLFRLRPSSPLS